MTREADDEFIEARIKVLKKQLAACRTRISLLEGGDLPKALESEKTMRKNLIAELEYYQMISPKKTADLNTRVERALARLYSADFHYPESGNPVMLKVAELDESAGTATIDMGVCTYREGSMYGAQIKSYLERKFPELNHVKLKLREVD